MAISVGKKHNRIINTWDFQGALEKKINKDEFTLRGLRLYSYRNWCNLVLTQ